MEHRTQRNVVLDDQFIIKGWNPGGRMLGAGCRVLDDQFIIKGWNPGGRMLGAGSGEGPGAPGGSRHAAPSTFVCSQPRPYPRSEGFFT